MINDQSVLKVCSMTKALEHLELTGCEKLSEYQLTNIVREYPALKFLELSHIPVVNAAFYENLKTIRPELLGRRFKQSDIDLKDNMLRVPLRIAEKGKAKKGKKKKKKK